MPLRKYVYYVEDGLCCSHPFVYDWCFDDEDELMQKRAMVESLHRNFKKARPEFKLLEISSVADKEIGLEVCPLRLRDLKGNFVEGVYQGSIIYEEGQMLDLYNTDNPAAARRANRERGLNVMIGFDIYGRKLPIEPFTLALNWIWCEAVYNQKHLMDEVVQYDGFTNYYHDGSRYHFGDYIEAACVFVTLHRRGILDVAMKDIDSFALNVYGVKI